MRLLAISDLHVSHRANREALDRVPPHPSDWLIVAGDVGERPEHLTATLDILTARFARVIWTPGNHDLWAPRTATDRTRGLARYEELLAICRRYGVVTPEDPFLVWPAEPDTFIVPMFLLFDYSFRPANVPIEDAVRWARDRQVMSGDELMLDPAPYSSLAAWCAARCDLTEARLAGLPDTSRTILINHWPLRYDLARPPRVPEFSVWSGTTRTESWAERFRARRVISGHLHMRTTLWRGGIRFDEVSLGYPRDWRHDRGMAAYFRQVLPESGDDPHDFVPPRDPFVR
jgi:predicted phosphodiesterase